MIDSKLISIIQSHFRLDWNGIHGVSHWARVRVNGLRLAERTGANPRVVELFSFLHDSHRHNDGIDPMHGERAAKFSEKIRQTHIDLPDDQFELLLEACRGHTHGEWHGDVTVMTCWDADRLDLGRVGIRPDPERLLTDAARDRQLIEWAYKRSRSSSTF